jgi:signal transduction histidine kinase
MSPPEYAAATGTVYAQVVDAASGRELGRSPSLADGVSLAAAFAGGAMDDQPIDFPTVDGRWLRVVRSEAQIASPYDLPPWLQPPASPTDAHAAEHHAVMVMSAVDASAAHRDLRLLAGVLAALWLVATALSALVSVWLRHALLSPITRISDLIGAIDPEQLAARIPSTEVPQEMQVVLERLNTLMAKLDAAFARERTTIANIAHELRTPIAGLRATLEFALARGPHASRDEDLQDCLRMTQEMQGMIINLLMLARLESGQARLTPQPVDIREVVGRALAPLAERLRARELTVDVRVPERLMAFAGEEHLLIIAANILDNAASYAIGGQAIVISGAVQDGAIDLEFSNATDGRPLDTSEIFTPFWRGEEARTSGSHCGLGLTLVQRLVHLAGGSVSARVEGLNLFRLTVRLPLPPAGGGSAGGTAAGSPPGPTPAR